MLVEIHALATSPRSGLCWAENSTNELAEPVEVQGGMTFREAEAKPGLARESARHYAFPSTYTCPFSISRLSAESTTTQQSRPSSADNARTEEFSVLLYIPPSPTRSGYLSLSAPMSGETLFGTLRAI
jgi:hypothetical protein